MKKANFQEPFILFNEWLKKAKDNPQIAEPNAMIVSTIEDGNKPTSRMMLLKKFDENGFCFFTNTNSKKAKNLATNPNVALCFYWTELGYQVRVEGLAKKVTSKEADEYFSSRRRGSQAGAWSSKQSEELEDEKEFEDRITQIDENFKDQDIPRPPFWSGYKVIPSKIEFWEEGEFRIHKRTLYSKSNIGNEWGVVKLYP